MTDREMRQNRKDESYPDFDVIEINIAIKDDIVIEEELHHTSVIGEAELELSNVDFVEEQAKMSLEAVLMEYQQRRDGDSSD